MRRCAMTKVLLRIAGTLALGASVATGQPGPNFTSIPAAGPADQPLASTVLFENFTGGEFAGWSIELGQRVGATVVDVVEGVDLIALDPEFSEIVVVSSAFTAEVIQSFSGSDVIPDDYFGEVYVATYVADGPGVVERAFTTADLTDPSGVVFAASGYCGDLEFWSPFVRGDCNGDTAVDVADIVTMLGGLFLAEPTGCAQGCDIDGEGGFAFSDVFFGLAFLFAGSPPPPAPYPICGFAPGSGTFCDGDSCP